MKDDSFFKLAGVAIAIWFAVALASAGFVVWIIVKLLQHFGVI